MGMYEEINGQQIKLTGNLLVAARRLGFFQDPACSMELKHTQVGCLIREYLDVIGGSQSFTKDHTILTCKIITHKWDLDKVLLLIDWYNTHTINDGLFWV